MDFSTYDGGFQVGDSVISENGEITTLEDKKYPWAVQRIRTVKLSRLYLKAGYQDYAMRSGVCATWLEFGVYADGTKRLRRGNFCKLRLCPMCIARRARKAALKLSKVLNQVEGEHGCNFLFLTLTIRNVPGSELGDAISQLTKAWFKLVRHRQVERAVQGWYRAIEITRGDDRWHKDKKTGRRKFRRDEGYHPHIHAILAVPPEYFKKSSGLYIKHDEWVARWRLALKADYDPTVRIQVTKKTGKTEEGRGGLEAALEAAKYTVKDEEYIDDTLPDSRLVEVLTDYTEGLRRKRLTAFGGWLKDAAKELDAENLEEDDDLVHADDEGVRGDIAELIETYNWHFGAGDYILTSREINPLRVAGVNVRQET